MHALTVTHAFGTCLEEIWIHNILIFIANKKKKKKGKNCQIIFIYLFFLNFFFFFPKESQTHMHMHIFWDLCLAILEWINKPIQ
jgi:hypothetical protein